MTERPAEDDDEGTVLARLGPFFAVRTHDAGAPVHAPWRSMGELADGREVLSSRVAVVRDVLAAGGGQRPEQVELRVAASVAHLGLTARVVSPYLALAVLHGRAPSALRLADLRWQPSLGNPYPLSLPGAGRRSAEACRELPPLADALARGLCEGPVRELVDACAAFRVSPHVLWGNVASAVHGAARMIGAARPEDAIRARGLAELLLDSGALRGSGARTAAGDFRRRSCCLIYRAAPEHSGALCGDCALSHVPSRSA